VPVARLRLADECINTASCPHKPRSLRSPGASGASSASSAGAPSRSST
jgi:hypothetical protein